MSRSSVDFPLLVIRAMIDGEYIAKVSIGADGNLIYQAPPKFVPDIIDTDESRGVIYSDSLDRMAQYPLCVYIGDDSTLPTVILKEETGYEIDIDYVDGSKGKLDLRYYDECMGGAKLNLSKFDDNRAFLVFRSYVGKGFLKIDMDDGRSISIPFEVRSSKIGYRYDYPRMLEDVARFSMQCLLDSKSPLYRGYRPELRKSHSSYEDFLLLEYFFDTMGFIEAFEHVSRNLNNELVSDFDPTPVFQAVNIDLPEVIANWSSGPMLEFPGLAMGECIPEFVNSRYFFENIDTPENRVVKDMILGMDFLIRDLKMVEERKPESQKSTYVSDKLSIMEGYVNQCLAHDWLQSVGDLTIVPFNSTVLQFKRGYSDIFAMYQMLGFGSQFSQEDLPDLLKGHGRKVHSVYEYWCLIQIFNCLRSMSDISPDLLEQEGSSGTRISICKGQMRFKLKKEFGSLNVILHYNKKFEPTESKFRSYSIGMRPDYTLEIFSDDQDVRCIVNFDAKYKVKHLENDFDDDEMDGTCWEYDLYKMHTYRDALMRSVGSYVLYPGEETIESFPRADTEIEENYIPSVGFISLNPRNPEESMLRTHLGEIFSKIMQKEFDSGEEFF